MKHNRKQTINILKFAKTFNWTLEEALILKGIKIKAILEKNGKRFKLVYK